MGTPQRGLVLAAFVAALVTSQSTSATDVAASPLNLDFEIGPAAFPPTGWTIKVTAGASITAEADAVQHGSLGLELRNGEAKERRDFVSISQRIDATPFRGRRLRLSGMASNKSGSENGGNFWIKVDDQREVNLAVGSSAQDPVRTESWKSYSAYAPIPPNAQSISFGFRLNGSGITHVDDITLTDVGSFDEGNAPPKPLSARGLDNVVAFARLYGYVRYFHPSDEATNADWPTFLRVGIEQVEAARTDGALREALRALFAPLAPTVRIGEMGEPKPPVEDLKGEVVAWQHHGLGLSANPTRVYKSERIAPAAGTPIEVRLDLPHGLIAYVPIQLARVNGNTIPHASTHVIVPRKMPDGWIPTGDDRTSRLAAVVEAWNIPQHFSPVLEILKIDWAAQLRNSLKQAAVDEGVLGFDVTMRRLSNAMRDGHGLGIRTRAPTMVPFAWEWIEDNVVVTSPEGVEGLQRGDVVLALDGQTISDLLSRCVPPLVGATPAHWRYNALTWEVMAGNVDQPMMLTVSRSGQTLRVQVHLQKQEPNRIPASQPRPTAIADLEPGILYVDLTRLTPDELHTSFERIARSPAIVFEVRGYPTDAATEILLHLSENNIKSDRLRMPVYTQPDQRSVTYEDGSWDVPSAPPRFPGRFVFMTDERATSLGESVMGAVEVNRLGDIVGAHTSGTNGNYNSTTLITGHVLQWTGLEVTQRDGSQRFGVGVQPTIPAHRTIAGVRAGRDEVLEVAIAAARKPR